VSSTQSLCEASKHNQYQLILPTGLFIFLHLSSSPAREIHFL